MFSLWMPKRATWPNETTNGQCTSVSGWASHSQDCSNKRMHMKGGNISAYCNCKITMPRSSTWISTQIAVPMSELCSDPCVHKVFNDVPHPIGSIASVPCSVNKLRWQKALSVASGLHPSAAGFWCCHEESGKSKKIWPHQQKTTFSSWLLTLNACVMVGKSQSLPFRCSQLLIVCSLNGCLSSDNEVQVWRSTVYSQLVGTAVVIWKQMLLFILL